MGLGNGGVSCQRQTQASYEDAWETSAHRCHLMTPCGDFQLIIHINM